VALILGAIVLTAGCATTGSSGVGSPVIASDGAPVTRGPSQAPASASPELCTDKAALQTALDALEALNPRTAPKPDLIAAIGAVDLAVTGLTTSAAGIPGTHIGALRVATDLATRLVPNGGSEEIFNAVKGLVTVGHTVLGELPAC
jgi:hypothetical protein